MSSCIQSVNHSQIKCEEKQSKFVLLNPQRKPVEYITVDGCIYPRGHHDLCCDYALNFDNTTVFVELKGSDIAHAIKRADIVVAALGVPHFVKSEWIKPGAAVLDVGITRVDSVEGSSLLGDVDPSVREVAGFVSPNPGGVGPMTRAMLVRNVVKAASY
jgi:hypothetical protein